MVALLADTRPRTHSSLRTREEVHATAEAFTRLARPITREHGNAGKEVFLRLGPSMIQLGQRTVDTTPFLFGMSREAWIDENGPMDDDLEPGQDEDSPTRGKITGWSQKSRNNMRRRLGTLDYSPMFKHGRQLPKMVTLSMPARWENVAPDARTFKRRLVDIALRQTFRRHWGYDFIGVWKLEFQRRGAPHLHILTAPPSGDCPKTGETFETWLRMIWAKACSDADTTETEYRDHLAKGVHIADTFGLTGTDAKRIADYFVKHGAFRDKEYQNVAPELWTDEDGDKSPGRFWGYWGLARAEGEAVLGFVDDGPIAGNGGGSRRVGQPDNKNYVK